MRFVRLLDTDGNPINVRLDQIQLIARGKTDDTASVMLIGGPTLGVRGGVEEVTQAVERMDTKLN